MKKIIAAFDGLKYSESTEKYAIQLARQSSAHLVGLFPNDYTYHSYKVYELIQEEGGVMTAKQRKLDARDVKKRGAAAKQFEKACQDAGLEYSLHQDHSVAIQDLLHESIYADLLIIDRTESFSHHPQETPTFFIRDLLADTQCPVLVVPQVFKPISKLLLLYDGEPSSVHAIKMFSYTLASLKECPVKLLSVRSNKQPRRIPDNKLMTEFAKLHYPRTTFTTLKGEAETEILKYLEGLENTLVVLGAYRRGRVSRWFRHSLADVLMKKLQVPLFIAHNK
jgi:hypothetical protein